MLGLGGAAGAVRGLWPEAEDGESGIPDVEWLGGGRLPRPRDLSPDGALTKAENLQRAFAGGGKGLARAAARPALAKTIWEPLVYLNHQSTTTFEKIS